MFPKSCFSVDARDTEGKCIQSVISPSNCKLKMGAYLSYIKMCLVEAELGWYKGSDIAT